MTDRYDELWTAGRRAVLRGDATVESGPRGTGRWSPSVVLRLHQPVKITVP